MKMVIRSNEVAWFAWTFGPGRIISDSSSVNMEYLILTVVGWIFLMQHLNIYKKNGINGTHWSAGPRWGDYPYHPTDQ